MVGRQFPAAGHLLDTVDRDDRPVRQRETVGHGQRPCALCGGDVVVVRTWSVRRGLARLNPAFDPHEHRYELCRGCGAKNYEVGGAVTR